jgi:hypothetical protein
MLDKIYHFHKSTKNIGAVCLSWKKLGNADYYLVAEEFAKR